jgi:hypothetical protein
MMSLNFFTIIKYFLKVKFGRKFLTIQSDWDGEYEKSNSFFQRIGILIKRHDLMLIHNMDLKEENIETI